VTGPRISGSWTRNLVSWKGFGRIGPLAAVALSVCGCQQGKNRISREPAIREIPHSGDRRDAPPLAERGNAAFQSATFDDEGKLLVTAPFMGPSGVQVWDAKTGDLLANIDASIPYHLWMIDSRRQRLLGYKPSQRGLHLFDLRTGREISTIPDEAGRPARAAGLTADGNEVLLFKPGWLEVWQMDPPALVRRAESPLPLDHYFPGCVGGIPSTYNDKSCWEWSADRRTLALAYTPVFSPMSESHFVLIDVATLEARELRLPSERKSRYLAAFAFSPDGQKLAVGTDQELFIYDRALGRWGPTILGDHKRNQYLGAMRFTADASKVIALGDLTQVSVYDVASGKRVGRRESLEGDEGDLEFVFRVSLDGRRIVLYHFVSDTFEVLDGRDAGRLGWVCPYFCNAKHNPEEAPFAVSPDGESVAVSHRRGTAVWNVASDSLKFALHDPQRTQLQR
jgi:WD40 repeat protein